MFCVDALDLKYFRESSEIGERQKELCYTLTAELLDKIRTIGCSPSRSIQGESHPWLQVFVLFCEAEDTKKEKHGSPAVLNLHGSTHFIAILLKVLVQGKGFPLTSESSY